MLHTEDQYLYLEAITSFHMHLFVLGRQTRSIIVLRKLDRADLNAIFLKIGAQI